jgi:hypothetical protein
MAANPRRHAMLGGDDDRFPGKNIYFEFLYRPA